MLICLSWLSKISMARRSFEHFVCLIKCFINSVKHAADIHPDGFATPIESGGAPFIMFSQFYSRKDKHWWNRITGCINCIQYGNQSPSFTRCQLSNLLFITTSNHFGLSYRLHSGTAIFISIIYVRRTVDSPFRHSSNFSKKRGHVILV